MFNITDIQSLGSDYTVSDSQGNIIQVIQVIPVSEIYEAALGPYNEEKFGSFDNYIKESIATLSGFDAVDPYKVYWFSTTEEEVPVSELIEYAVAHGYDRIIMEYLEDLE